MDIEKLDSELRLDEGVRYSPYLDSRGIKTVGVGHNMIANPLPPSTEFPLSDDEVNQLLNGDLQKVFKALDFNLPWWRTLDEVRQRVLANMCFNMGIGTLLQFKHTISCIKSGDYSGAAEGMLNSTWAHQVGDRANRLSDMMNSGQV